MEHDDTGTFARLRSIRDEVVDPAIVSHGGRIVKTTGDGLLAEFTNVLAALLACIHIQREMAVRNRDQIAEERLHYRIGVNLGDIMVDANAFGVFLKHLPVSLRLGGLNVLIGITQSGDVGNHPRIPQAGCEIFQ
jgi:class 3 adenylate cyclase